MTDQVTPTFYGADWSGSFSSSYSVQLGSGCQANMFQHIDYDGTYIKFGVSHNGVDVSWGRVTLISSFLGAITHVGISYGGGSSGTENYQWLHWHIGAQGTSGITA